MDWDRIKMSDSYKKSNYYGPNRNATECRKFKKDLNGKYQVLTLLLLNLGLSGEICSEECSSAGCWSKGSDQCLECKHLLYNGTCLKNCKAIEK